MPNKSLIVVFTPLQFLNAQAYLRQFPQIYRLIVLTDSQKNIEQIKLLAGNSIEIGIPFKRMRLLFSEISWILKFLYVLFFIQTKNYENIVIGNFKNVLGYHLGKRFAAKNKQVILLDDGLATISLYRERNLLNQIIPSRLFGGKVLLYFYQILNRKSIPFSVSLYSIYNFDVICLPKIDTVVKQNSLVHSEAKPLNNELWFIGQPLLEQRKMGEDFFNNQIRKVKNYAKGKGLEFHYIKHRSERPKAGLDTKEFDLPLEVVVQNLKVYPGHIVSFYSSALINIASFFPQIKCSYINLYKIETDFDRLQSVYALFELHPNLKEFTFFPSLEV